MRTNLQIDFDFYCSTYVRVSLESIALDMVRILCRFKHNLKEICVVGKGEARERQGNNSGRSVAPATPSSPQKDDVVGAVTCIRLVATWQNKTLLCAFPFATNTLDSVLVNFIGFKLIFLYDFFFASSSISSFYFTADLIVWSESLVRFFHRLHTWLLSPWCVFRWYYLFIRRILFLVAHKNTYEIIVKWL